MNELVLEPRHDDTSRGVVIRRATQQHARISCALGRSGVAEAASPATG